MKAMGICGLVGGTMICLIGCARNQESASQSVTQGPIIRYSWSETLFSREIHLSVEKPFDLETKIRLVSVDSNQCAKIRLESGELLSGKPGDHFSCKQFGESNLQLVAVSPTGAIWMSYMWSEPDNNK